MEEMKAENKILKTNEFDFESRTKNTELKIAKLEAATEHILLSTLPVGGKSKPIKEETKK